MPSTTRCDQFFLKRSLRFCCSLARVSGSVHRFFFVAACLHAWSALRHTSRSIVGFVAHSRFIGFPLEIYRFSVFVAGGACVFHQAESASGFHALTTQGPFAGRALSSVPTFNTALLTMCVKYAPGGICCRGIRKTVLPWRLLESKPVITLLQHSLRRLRGDAPRTSTSGPSRAPPYPASQLFAKGGCWSCWGD